MVGRDDLVILPYGEELTRAGMAYSCRMAAVGRLRRPVPDGLRAAAAEAGVELALRRHLRTEGVYFDTARRGVLGQSGQYDLVLGGRPVILKTGFLNEKKTMSVLQAGRSSLLRRVVHISEQELDGGDLYLFALAAGRLMRSTQASMEACASGLPVFLTHLFPGAEVRRGNQVIIEARTAAPALLELGGCSAVGEYRTVTAALLPGARTTVVNMPHILRYAALERPVRGEILFDFSGSSGRYAVLQHQWVNSWIYGAAIVLLGYSSRVDLYRTGQRRPGGGIAIPVHALQPIRDLFARATLWRAGSRQSFLEGE